MVRKLNAFLLIFYIFHLMLVVSFIPLVTANNVTDSPPQTTPIITMHSPINGEHYSGQDVSLVFDVQEPSTWPGYVFLDFLHPRPRINWIKYSVDNSEAVNAPRTAVRDENTRLFTYHCENTLEGLLAGEHELKIMLSYSTPLEQEFGTEYQTNMKSRIVSFSVGDNIPPAVFLTHPANTTYNENMVKLQFTINESASVSYILDNKEMISVTENPTLTLSGLSDGSHSIMLVAQDMSGNFATSQTVYFTIETFPTLWVLVTAVASLTLTFVIAFIIYKRRRTCS